MTLEVGAEAPDFTLKDQNNQPVTLSDYRGTKNVLLIFFPLAFTGTCQGELCRVRDELPKFENDDTAVLAVSVGPPPTHKIWSAEQGYTFPLLSDFWPHGAVAQQYGVFNEDLGFANRGTFLIDTAGMVRFAEMMGPGEARDQGAWENALATLDS
ncbi:peroxiredoxin [Rhodococcus sp. BP-349]|uniref:peroxiredoxin n=1 Tax=unclassified Rhodococcus (in: high G+C Gram-positive bacteria) TaxID=192944 RepID=UPI001C9B7716|nr:MULTISPECIES: peroxiredoxin [unclassified Rhodococcus (in: high G+C Gram-positive bacteria)]MBY6540647.1 peroxiredoxin [Rhodococcus sp. BP-363]MBY6545328.1 peroxiredoxin [Rhodococcus sp. BP-369]MBY6564558.1 peroxiredoxin [Rhodococcus sp. BP-370]MBY6578506.1 peroxiredoxin [Rhodococcus sp. BP-364]MBY6587807.1 peroxiredoxin [Rhodococcus sp. BP-358]